MIKHLFNTEEREGVIPQLLDKSSMFIAGCQATCASSHSSSTFQDDLDHVIFVTGTNTSVHERLKLVLTRKLKNRKRVWKELSKITLSMNFSTF